LRTSGDLPRGIVLDAGPLIALTWPADPDHAASRAGFDTLIRRRTRLLVPLPIVFEVYKWLLHQAGTRAAHAALADMRAALEIIFPDQGVFDDVAALVLGLGVRWNGSLEDALVAALAIRLNLPAWTLNYRDLAAFPRLSLWAP
jgi:predicted nucleic acid-binding protein